MFILVVSHVDLDGELVVVIHEVGLGHGHGAGALAVVLFRDTLHYKDNHFNSRILAKLVLLFSYLL